MRAEFEDSQQRLRDSLFDLYELGGFDLMGRAAKDLKRDLIIRCKTCDPHSDDGEIIHFYAVNRWDEDDFFDEWAKPSIPLSPEAEQMIGTTNAKLARCRSVDNVLSDFILYLCE